MCLWLSWRRCKHKIAEVPRWISSSKVCSIVVTQPNTNLLAATLCLRSRSSERFLQRTPPCCKPPMSINVSSGNAQCSYLLTLSVYVHSLRESLGISADGSEKMYRLDDVEAFEKAVPTPLVWYDRDHRKNVRFCFTAVDPSGGGASAFSICSVLVYEGKIQVRVYLDPTFTPSPSLYPPTSNHP